MSPLSFYGLSSPDSVTSLQGIDEGPEGLKLISDIIREKMGIDVSVLMGANIASEVAAEKFCETTIGELAVGLGGPRRPVLQDLHFQLLLLFIVDSCLPTLHSCSGYSAGEEEGGYIRCFNNLQDEVKASRPFQPAVTQ